MTIGIAAPPPTVATAENRDSRTPCRDAKSTSASHAVQLGATRRRVRPGEPHLAVVPGQRGDEADGGLGGNRSLATRHSWRSPPAKPTARRRRRIDVAVAFQVRQHRAQDGGVDLVTGERPLGLADRVNPVAASTRVSPVPLAPKSAAARSRRCPAVQGRRAARSGWPACREPGWGGSRPAGIGSQCGLRCGARSGSSARARRS